MKKAFSDEGSFYKGNLHVHSTYSDGIQTDSELVKLYKEGGYNFLAITDHNQFFKSKEFNSDSFIVIPGIECDVDIRDPLRIHHIVGINESEDCLLEHKEKVEKIVTDDIDLSLKKLVKLMEKKKLKMIYAHPLWSRVDVDDYCDVGDFFAMEIYNTVCDFNWRVGYSTFQWDLLLQRGKKIWGVASDDSHGWGDTYMKGYVMVKAESLDEKSILQSLINGNFYSSQGPKIHDFYIENNIVSIKCSKVKEIVFITYEKRGEVFLAKEKEYMESIEYTLRGDENYVRVEIIDESGKKAWTNPIFL